MAERGAGRARPKVVEETAAGDHDDRVVCTVAFCPICTAVTTARSLAPEAVDHLLNAAREFFLAARAVIDVRADDLKADHQEERRTRLQKIEIG